MGWLCSFTSVIETIHIYPIDSVADVPPRCAMRQCLSVNP